MRRLGGWLLVVGGLLLGVVGAGAAVWIGPDDAVDSATVHVDSPVAAIVTGPGVIDYAGPTVRLDVASQNGPVFLGVGSQVDVQDFVSDVSRTQIDDVELPSDLQVSDVSGSQEEPVAAGEDLDWWIESATGERAEVEFRLPDKPISVVVMTADGASSVVVDMQAAVEIPGIFWGAIAAAISGVGLLILGILTLRRGRRGEPTTEADEAS